MRKEVVITAMAAISGNGDSITEVFANMLQGRAARVDFLDHPDIWKDFPDTGTVHEGSVNHVRPYMRDGELVTLVCGVMHTNEELFVMTELKAKNPKDRATNHDRHQLLAFVVARRLFDRVGGVETVCEPERFGIMGGTGNGGLSETYSATLDLEQGRKLGPRANLRELPNTFTGKIANVWGIRGAGGVDVGACAASLNALINAIRAILLDEADAVLVIGSEAVIVPFGIASFVSQDALWKESQPYQKGRKGFLMGEGAAALLIESKDNAVKRGAPILAEIAGYGSTTDGNSELKTFTLPDPKGGARASACALEMAKMLPQDITYIKTHGTGTDADAIELNGIEVWAGKELARRIPISSIKSFSGHLLGAAGAFEVALCIKMMHEGYLLPTYGLTPQNVDPALADFNHVMHTMPMGQNIRNILCNNFGFGGVNASLILKRPD